MTQGDVTSSLLTVLGLTRSLMRFILRRPVVRRRSREILGLASIVQALVIRRMTVLRSREIREQRWRVHVAGTA